MTEKVRDPISGRSKLTTAWVIKKGWIPVRYRIDNGKMLNEARHGWIVARDTKTITIRLMGEDRNRVVPLSEERYMTEIKL